MTKSYKMIIKQNFQARRSANDVSKNNFIFDNELEWTLSPIESIFIIYIFMVYNMLENNGADKSDLSTNNGEVIFA